MLNRCPGQDRRFWKPDDVFERPCPRCGEAVEFWKDDPRRRCGRCGATLRNPRFEAGCSEWCDFADQCLGAGETPDTTLREALIREMKRVFGDDHRRIRHALRVLEFAERILDGERADPLVVFAPAVLHDIGIPEAERKHGSSAGKYQEIEGPPVARRILRSAGVDAERTDHVCPIIADHHSTRTMDTLEFRVLWDADNLVNRFTEAPQPLAGDAEALVRRLFKTPTGRELALRRCRMSGDAGGSD